MKSIEEMKQDLLALPLPPMLSFASDLQIKALYRKYCIKEDITNNVTQKEVILYHGSNKIVKVEDIKLPGPRDDCDFGPGFYMTPNRQIAEEWVRKIKTPVINKYKLIYIK